MEGVKGTVSFASMSDLESRLAPVTLVPCWYAKMAKSRCVTHDEFIPVRMNLNGDVGGVQVARVERYLESVCPAPHLFVRNDGHCP